MLHLDIHSFIFWTGSRHLDIDHRHFILISVGRLRELSTVLIRLQLQNYRHFIQQLFIDSDFINTLQTHSTEAGRWVGFTSPHRHANPDGVNSLGRGRSSEKTHFSFRFIGLNKRRKLLERFSFTHLNVDVDVCICAFLGQRKGLGQSVWVVSVVSWWGKRLHRVK